MEDSLDDTIPPSDNDMEYSLYETTPEEEEEMVSLGYDLIGNKDLELGESSKRSKKTRGRSGMKEITRVRSEGKRRVIEYNEDGQPIGRHATSMQSSIGTCVRFHVPLSYESWRFVPRETKDKILELIQDAYVIDPRSKKNILESAGVAYRNYKYRLTKEFIKPFENDPESLKHPPYPEIEEHDWTEFVKSRLAAKFKEESRKKCGYRGKNQYDHRVSRKGYANLKEEMKKSLSDQDTIDRSSVWKKARIGKDGNVKNESTQQMINRIDELHGIENNEEEEKFVRDDILSKALGSKDPPGKVRGVGKFVTPTKYFNTPSQKPKAKQSDSTQFDAEKARMAAYILELEEKLYKLDEAESSKKKKLEETIEVKEKKRKEMGEKMLKNSEKKGKAKETTENASHSDTFQVGTTCRLAIGSKNNVVAAGTIFEDDGEVVSVSIDLVVDGECPVPILKKGEENVLSQEIGSHLQWPRHLVILDKDKDTECNDIPILPAPTPYQSAPVALRCLFSLAKRIKSSIQIQVPEVVFGRNVKCSIWMELLKDFCEMSPIGTSCIDAYMLCLHEQVINKRENSICKFLDAGCISISNNKESRVQVLANRIEGLDVNDLLIVPYNSGNHWILIIIDHSKCLVQWMDPLTNRIPQDVNEVIGLSFKRLKLKKPQWKLVKGPKQPGVVECGYYILKFMKEIVLHNTASIQDIMKDAPRSYTQDEIDFVRSEWAEYVGKRVYFA